MSPHSGHQTGGRRKKTYGSVFLRRPPVFVPESNTKMKPISQENSKLFFGREKRTTASSSSLYSSSVSSSSALAFLFLGTPLSAMGRAGLAVPCKRAPDRYLVTRMCYCYINSPGHPFYEIPHFYVDRTLSKRYLVVSRHLWAPFKCLKIPRKCDRSAVSRKYLVSVLPKT